jgi:hypothetical protein
LVPFFGGLVPPGGDLSSVITIPPLPPIVVVAQAAVIGPATGFQLSNPSFVALP